MRRPPTTRAALPFAAPLDADARHGELPPLAAGFLERLRRLPLGSWADAARALDESGGLTLSGDVSAPLTDAARARLRWLMDEMPGVTTKARRRVHDLAAVAQGFLHPREVARMKKAALTAVLALVARPDLDDDEFARLYAPFATLLPLEALAGGAEDRRGADMVNGLRPPA